MSIDVAKRPLWTGRTLALLGIVFTGLSMRFAVGALSPLIPFIRDSYDVTAFEVGLLGWLAPFSFAIGGYFTPRIERRLGIERTLALGLLVTIAGAVLRGFSNSWILLALGTFVALLGTGVINVAMPPAVRKYFPDRIGGVTSVYVSLMAISAMLPPLVDVTVANEAGWHVSLAQWGFYGVAAAIPWVLEYFRHRNDKLPEGEDPTQALKAMHAWRSPTAWAVGCTLVISSIIGYSNYGWLPVMITDIAHLTPAQGGLMLAIYAGIGLPIALVVPLLAKRMRGYVHWLVTLASVFLLIGYLGLIFAPSFNTWMWIVILGFGSLQFPLSMVLINLRTESVRSSMGLSGFVQIVGYSGALLGLIVLTSLNTIFHAWLPVLIALIVIPVLVNIPIAITLRRNRTVDAELAERATAAKSTAG